MDVPRVWRDLELLQQLVRQGEIRQVDWSVDPRDPWITIFGAFRLPPERFNLPDCNLKLPLPVTLYDPVPGAPRRAVFYTTVFIDEALRQRGSGGRWELVRRQFVYNQVEGGKGWAFLCVYPHAVGPETDVRALFPVVQRFLFNPR